MKQVEKAHSGVRFLEVEIRRYEIDAEAAENGLRRAQEDIAAYEGDQNAVTKVREMERGSYRRSRERYEELVGSLETAIASLRSEYDAGRANTTLELVRSHELLSTDLKRAAGALLAHRPL